VGGVFFKIFSSTQPKTYPATLPNSENFYRPLLFMFVSHFRGIFLPQIFNQWEKLRVWIPFILAALHSPLLSAVYFTTPLERSVRTSKIKRESGVLHTGSRTRPFLS